MWHCSCGCINAGVNDWCPAALTWKNVEHSQISENTLDSLRIWKARKELEEPVTQQEELFATYYNRGKILVKDMDDTTLREHRGQLQLIATEAKAQLLAADDEIRERSAKKHAKDREWLVTVDPSSSQAVSDAINVPKQRKERMSKMDKIKDQLSAYLDPDILSQTVRALEAKATGSNPNVETVILTKPSTTETVIQVEKSTKNEPFDWSSIIKK